MFMARMEQEMQAVQNVLLINPPGKCFVRKIDGSIVERKHCQPPLGLAYLGATCLKAGYDVEILDILAEGYDNERLTEHFIVYGLEIDDVLARVGSIKPDIIGFSILFSHLASECYEIIRRIRSEYPDIVICVGGHHPSAMPEKVLENQDIDYVLTGECDHTFPAFLDALNGRGSFDEIRGLYYRDDGRVRSCMQLVRPAKEGSTYKYFYRKDGPNPRELEALPYPAWHLLDMHRYWKTQVRMGGGNVMRDRYFPMVASRGCPHTCFYCTSPLMGGYKGYRKRTVEDVIAEIRWLKDTYDVEEIQFLDDNFSISVPRVKELLRGLAKNFPDIVFSVPAGTEVNALDDEVIELMAKANFYRVLLAIEAGDQTIQDTMIDKRVDLGRAPAVIKKCKEVGLEVRGYFMLGFPNEKRSQILHTAEFATSLDLDDFALSVVSPLPGTPLYDQCLSEGLLTEDFDINDVRYSVSNIKLPDISADELEDIRRRYWADHKSRKIAEGAGRTDAVVRFKSVEEFSGLGFKTKIPAAGR